MRRRASLFAGALAVAGALATVPVPGAAQVSGAPDAPQANGAAQVSGAAGAPTPADPCIGRARRSSTLNRVMIIVFENHDYEDVIGPAPYMTSLARRCGNARNYHEITRPSLPNYLAMTSGSTHGVTNSCLPEECPIRATNVFAQAVNIGREWRAYQQSMPTPCAQRNEGLYVVRHNPAAYYRGHGVHRACKRWDVRLGNTRSGPLAHALDGHLRALSFVTPNQCNNMHDCPVSTGDRWLERWMPHIIRSPGYQAGRLAVFITFDEGRRTSRIPMIVVSPYTRPGPVDRAFNHYSLLRATEYIIGAKRFLGGAADREFAGLARAFNLHPPRR